MWVLFNAAFTEQRTFAFASTFSALELCFLIHFMAVVSFVIIKSPHKNNSETRKYCGLLSEAEMALFSPWL